MNGASTTQSVGSNSAPTMEPRRCMPILCPLCSVQRPFDMSTSGKRLSTSERCHRLPTERGGSCDVSVRRLMAISCGKYIPLATGARVRSSAWSFSSRQDDWKSPGLVEPACALRVFGLHSRHPARGVVSSVSIQSGPTRRAIHRLLAALQEPERHGNRFFPDPPSTARSVAALAASPC